MLQNLRTVEMFDKYLRSLVRSTSPAECALGLTNPDDFISSKKLRFWCSIKSELSVVD